MAYMLFLGGNFVAFLALSALQLALEQWALSPSKPSYSVIKRHPSLDQQAMSQRIVEAYVIGLVAVGATAQASRYLSTIADHKPWLARVLSRHM